MEVFFLSLAKIQILYYIGNQFVIKFYSFYDSPYIQGYYRGQIFAGRHRLYVSSYEYGSGNLSRLYNEMPFPPFTVVEVYSFSGEPVEIYRLDREGHVIVDESDRMLYLIETDGGVFSYRMP